MKVPVLETERLILRGHRPEDFPAYAQMWADPGVTRFIGGSPLSEEDAWAKYSRVFGQWELLGFGFWSLIEKTSRKRIGEAGFLEGKRDMVPSIKGIPECGWALVPAAQGKGYATEAVRALLDWGDAHFGSARMVCLIAPENTPSLRVADKTGFREAARTTYKNFPTVVLYRDP
jgi:RimJ/RimL family protein N-acetyltransferase